MNLETRFSVGDRVRIARPVPKYGANAEGLTGCVVKGIGVSMVETHYVERGWDYAELYTLRCVVPPVEMTGETGGMRMLYGVPSACLEAE